MVTILVCDLDLKYKNLFFLLHGNFTGGCLSSWPIFSPRAGPDNPVGLIVFYNYKILFFNFQLGIQILKKLL